MFKRVLVLLVAVFMCFSIFSSCGKPVSKDDMVVGFMYIGSTSDIGWTYAHEQGRQAVISDLGVKTIYQENVAEDASCKDVMRNFIDQGAKIIFATSFGYMDYVKELASEFPDVKFMHCSGYETAVNMSNYFGRMYQARYLSGIVAGLKTKSNKIGYVAAYEIPEVVRGLNAFTMGVRSVNPDAQVYVTWTHTWYDPTKENDAAIALLDQGCDVMAQHQDTTSPQKAAESRGAYAIGYNTSSASAAPLAYMTAPIWDWGPYYVNQVQAVIDGKWKSESYWEGLDKGIVKLDALTGVAPEEAAAKVAEAEEKIKNGLLHVFEGPIKDNQGNLKVAEGSKMTDEEMLSFDWLVEGVVGSIE